MSVVPEVELALQGGERVRGALRAHVPGTAALVFAPAATRDPHRHNVHIVADAHVASAERLGDKRGLCDDDFDVVCSLLSFSLVVDEGLRGCNF